MSNDKEITEDDVSLLKSEDSIEDLFKNLQPQQNQLSQSELLISRLLVINQEKYWQNRIGRKIY